MTVDHSGPEVMEGVGSIFAEEAKIPGQTEAAAGASPETWASMFAWTEETFGPVSPERIATRANEEMQELLADPSDVMEAADVCIVLSRYPGLAEAIDRKMAINRARKWRLNGDGSGYHIKTEATASLEAGPAGYAGRRETQPPSKGDA